MVYTSDDHTFAICAYKENPFLEETIKSVINQTSKSQVLMATSTPNEFISGLAKKYEIPLFINENHVGMGGDWNYAYSRAKTRLVTVAHQDDVYDSDFARLVIEEANNSRNPILIFTDYYEMRDSGRVDSNRNLRIKRLMLLPLRGKLFRNSRWMRRRILSFGDPICCPSVTLNRDITGDELFEPVMRNSSDYLAWENMSRKEGAFVYIPKLLMGHRIYKESTTTQNLADASRTREDLEVMKKFWPSWFATLLHSIYINGEKSNNQ